MRMSNTSTWGVEAVKLTRVAGYNVAPERKERTMADLLEENEKLKKEVLKLKGGQY